MKQEKKKTIDKNKAINMKSNKRFNKQSNLENQSLKGIVSFYKVQKLCTFQKASFIPGRVKALVLRQDSDWLGARFGELRRLINQR